MHYVSECPHTAIQSCVCVCVCVIVNLGCASSLIQYINVYYDFLLHYIYLTALVTSYFTD